MRFGLAALLWAHLTLGAAGLDQASAAYDHGDFEEALAALQALETSSTDNGTLAKAELLRARCYAGLGKQDQVNAAFARALSFDPEVSLDPSKDAPDLVTRLSQVRSGASAEVTVKAESLGADLWIDGTLVGPPPYRARISIGRHRVDLRRGSTVVATQDIVLRPDQSFLVELRIPPESAPIPALASGSSTVAVPPPARQKHATRVVVLDFPLEKSFDANTNRLLTEFYATDLRQQGMPVMTSSDIAAALGVEKQKELLGCTESGCMADLGGALGADYIARGNIGVLDGQTAISLSIQDGRGQEVNRVAAHFAGTGPSLLLGKMEELVPQLVEPLREAGKILSVSSQPGRVDPGGAPDHPPPAVVTATSRTESSSHLPSYVCFAAGGVAAAVGAVLLGQGATDKSAVQQGYAVGGKANTELGTGGALLGVDLVAVGVGLYLMLDSPSASGPAPVSTTALGLTYRPSVDAMAFEF